MANEELVKCGLCNQLTGALHLFKVGYKYKNIREKVLLKPNISVCAGCQRCQLCGRQPDNVLEETKVIPGQEAGTKKLRVCERCADEDYSGHARAASAGV